MKLVTEQPTPKPGVEYESPPQDVPTATAKPVVLEVDGDPVEFPPPRRPLSDITEQAGT